jgi:threonine/homoserine/homoserine lactone efflux protein
MLNELLPFLGACTLIAATPGPSTILIIRQSLRSGRRAGFVTVLGNESGVFLWGTAAALGLTALLAASHVAYDVMRIVGAAVLIWFGVQSLRSSRKSIEAETETDQDADASTGSTSWRAYRVGLVTNLANPKCAVFAMSFLPQFVPSGAPKLPTLMLLAAIWAIYEVGYYGVYVWFVDRIRTLLSRDVVRQRMEKFSGVVLVGLGLRLALENG